MKITLRRSWSTRGLHGSCDTPGRRGDSAWPATDRSTHTLAQSTPPPPATRRTRCSMLLPRRRRFLVVRAPGQLLQERVCFSHDVQRRPRLRQVGFELRVPGAEPFQLDRLRRAPRALCRPPRTGPPPNAPASRARVHSITCDEYRPSRRRIAPFSPFGAFSYSATIASLYSALNDRRDGRGDGPPADRGPDDDDAADPPLPAPAPRRSSDDTSTRRGGTGGQEQPVVALPVPVRGHDLVGAAVDGGTSGCARPRGGRGDHHRRAERRGRRRHLPLRLELRARRV